MNDNDNLIREFYALSATEDWRSYRKHAVQSMVDATGAIAGAWLTQGPSKIQGEFTSVPSWLKVTARSLRKLEFESTDVILPAPEGEEAGKGVSICYHHADSELHSVISFWWDAEPSKDKVDMVQKLSQHMVEAGTISQLVYVQRDEWLNSMGRPNRGTTALIDATGVVYASSKSFRELITDSFDSKQVRQVPFNLPKAAFSDSGQFSVRSLRFRMSPNGNLFVLHARRSVPLDELSAREQEIARALGEGKTFKSVARDKGIAVSTVANHASRIYRKLGIFRREDLVELLRASRNVDRSEKV